jgi:hydrogenase maturation protease
MKTPCVLVIACGNSLAGDDSLSWRAANELVKKFNPPEVEIFRCDHLAPELAEKLGRYEAVIFINAAANEAGGVPAEVRVEEVAPEDTLGAAVRFSQQLSPATLLAVAELLYGAQPRALCATLTGETSASGESLSAAVERALPKLVTQVEELILQVEAG